MGLAAWTMLLTLVQAAPAPPQAPAPALTAPAVPLPPEALRDPYSYVLSQCSPLVLPHGSDPERCESRLWTAIREANPDTGGPRPAASTVAAPAPAPGPTATSGGRCRTVQTPRSGGGSVQVICGEPDADQVRTMNDFLRGPAAPACDRPASGESQTGWIARCQGLPR